MINISLMTNNVEHFFRFISALCVSSAGNSVFSSVPHFLIGLFGSLESNFLNSLYILDIRPLSDVGLVKKKKNPSLLFAILSHWQCTRPYRSFLILCGFICLFLILEHKPLVFCSGTFPLSPCAQDFSPLSLLLDSVYLVLCGGLWSTWTWALYREIEWVNSHSSTWYPPVVPAPFVKNVLLSTGWF